MKFLEGDGYYLKRCGNGRKTAICDFLGDQIWQIRNITKYSGLGGHVLTTKFGNSSIVDEDKIEAESKREIIPETE